LLARLDRGRAGRSAGLRRLIGKAPMTAGTAAQVEAVPGTGAEARTRMLWLPDRLVVLVRGAPAGLGSGTQFLALGLGPQRPGAAPAGVFLGDQFQIDANDGRVYIHANLRRIPLLGQGVPIPQQDNYHRAGRITGRWR
jgi:hypothetical protein